MAPKALLAASSVQPIDKLEALAGFTVSIEGTDVKATGRHVPGMDSGMIDHIVGEIAWSILAAAILDRMADEVQIPLQVNIERRNGPMRLGLLRLLFHIEDLIIVIEDHYTGALQLGQFGLLVTHDAAGLLLLCKIYKLLETEEQYIVGSNDKEIITDAEFVERKQEVTDGTKTRLVGRGAIIDDGDGLGVGGGLLPIFENLCELMIGDDDVLVDVGNLINISKHAIEDGRGAYLEKRLREVAGKLTQTGGIASSDDDGYHEGYEEDRVNGSHEAQRKEGEMGKMGKIS